MAAIPKSRIREGCPTHAARPGTAKASTSLCSRPMPPRSNCACSTPKGETELERIELPEYTDEIWHGYVPDIGPGHGVRLSRARAVRARGRPPLQPEQAAARSVCARPHRRADVEPRRASATRSAPTTTTSPSTSATARRSCRNASSSIRTSTGTASRTGRPVPWDHTILYETHVRGYTKLHPEVPEQQRGTFAGLGHERGDRLHQVARRHHASS